MKNIYLRGAIALLAVNSIWWCVPGLHISIRDFGMLCLGGFIPQLIVCGWVTEHEKRVKNQ